MSKSIIVFCILSLSQIFAHDKWDKKSLETYPFKQRVHELCSGHGVMHMARSETQELFNQFSKHHQDIVDLQTKGSIPNDNYLVQFTSFVIYSNLNKDQKHEVFRRSYQKYLDEAQNGSYWNDTLSVLIRKTRALTKEELESHLNSEDKWIRLAAGEALKNRSFREGRKKRGIASTHPEKARNNHSGSSQMANNETSASLAPPAWVYGVSGLFLVASIAMAVKMNGEKRHN